MYKLNLAVNNKFKIEERRRSVATLLAQSMTESEIAEQLQVTQATISRDIKVLKQMSQRFVFDLAKSDLAYYYKQCIDGIEEVRRKCWEIFKGQNNSNDNNTGTNDLTPKDKLLALKVLIDCNEAKFALFKEGPSIMHIKSLEERLENIESRQINR
jgi:DNA-binding transcriptional ArsR family regulator